MKKAVKDLQPGDILPAHPVLGGMSRRVILFTMMAKGIESITVVTSVLGIQAPSFNPPPAMPPETYRANDMIEVEPRATPEELEQLLEIARAHMGCTPPSVNARKQAQDLVNKLSPPNPPTYEELLDVVRRMCEPPRPYAEGQATPFSDCAKLAERARNAGLLK